MANVCKNVIPPNIVIGEDTVNIELRTVRHHSPCKYRSSQVNCELINFLLYSYNGKFYTNPQIENANIGGKCFV